MSYVLTLAIASFGLALLSCYGHHRHLHSFPTRRSSDLGGELADLRQPLDQLLVGIGQQPRHRDPAGPQLIGDRKSTRLNSSHVAISYAVFCLKKKKRLARLTFMASVQELEGPTFDRPQS